MQMNAAPAHIGFSFDEQHHSTGAPGYQGQMPMVPMTQPQNELSGSQPVSPWQPNPSAGDVPGYEGDVPDTDPEDNDSEEPFTGPPPPDFNSFEAPPGYQQAVLSAGAPLPPPAYEPPDEASRPEETFTGVGIIDEQQVRDAICAFADKNCCYGTGAAERMSLEKMEPSGGLHYQLESFTETRTTCWQHLPYQGGFVDGPHCGRAPAVWEIVCSPSELFNTHTKKIEVPHTSNVKTCHTCTGCGFVRCTKCQGRGKVRCSSCHGSGRRTVHHNGRSERRNCTWCHGSGRKRCSRCSGDGRVRCPTCEGYTKLRWFIELTVQYTNNLEDFIHETTDLPNELIRDVSGKVVFEQTLPYVWPISQYHIQEINLSSIEMVERHRSAWPNSKMLQQRQVLRSVPVTEVHYKFKDKDGRFWVYGNEQEVHCPDYPQSCCWGCTII